MALHDSIRVREYNHASEKTCLRTSSWGRKDPYLGMFCVNVFVRDQDASLLIMPLVFFMAPTDPQMFSTIDAILQSPSRGALSATASCIAIRRIPELTDSRARKVPCVPFGLWKR
jgi:hypothetical protein